MKLIPLLLLLSLSANLLAQSAARPVMQHSTTKELLDTVKTGSKTLEVSAAGTLEFKDGFTLTGGSYLKTSLSLNNVENTALSTWTGSTNLNTLGTITTGAWNGSVVGAGYGGTGQTNLQDAINALLAASGALSQGDLFYHNGANVVRLAAGTSGQYLQTQGAGANPQWATVSTGLTIDTTAISGGTVGRVLYHKTGNVVGELETSAGGNGSDDNGKLATYNASGNLTASQFNVQDGITSASYGPAALTFDDGAGNSTTLFVTLSGSNTVTLAANTGTILTTGALGANVATWLATPSKANLNAAVSDDDPAYVGTANTFTAAQTVSNTTDASSKTTGAVIVSGGVGIAKTLHANAIYGYGGTNGDQLGDGILVVHPSLPTLVTGGGVQIWNNWPLHWRTTNSVGLWGDVADRLWLRNSTRAQELLVANTWTSATSYEAAGIWWSSNVAYLGTQKGSGGGSARNVSLVYDSTPKLTINANTNDHEQPAKMKVYAVGSLPAAGTVGAYAVAAVSDALVPVVGSTVAGGGSAKALVCSNGTNWIVIATL